MEKEKLKNLPRAGWLNRPGWMHRRWFAYYMSLMFFIGGMVHVLDTEVAAIFFKVKGCYFSLIFMGVPASFASSIAYDTIHPGFSQSQRGPIYLIPTLLEIFTAALLLMCTSILIVLLLRRLQRFRRVFKILAYLNFLPHILFIGLMGLAAIQNIGATRPPAREESSITTRQVNCEYALANGIHIQTTTYLWHQPSTSEDEWGLSFEHDRFSVSTDSGKTWHEFMLLFRHGDCSRERNTIHTGTYDARFFWLWADGWIVRTQDGGTSWRVQYIRDESLMRYGTIAAISFDTPQTGQLIMEQTLYPDSNDPRQYRHYLTTTDGGSTWHYNRSERVAAENNG